MENNERNQPVIDIDYIDKLLSTYSPEPEKPAPVPEEPQQPAVAEEAVPAQPEAPAREPAATPQKTSLSLVLLTAVVCLLAGILLGRLTAPKPQPEPVDPTPTASTAPVRPTSPWTTPPCPPSS